MCQEQYVVHTVRLLFIAIPALIGADSEPRRQLSKTAARENAYSATQVTSVQYRRWRPSRNRIFCDQRYFCRFPVSDQFLLSESMFVL